MEPLSSLFQKATSLQYSILIAITLRNCEASEILSYFQANKLNPLVMDSERRYKTTESEMKDSWQ